MKNLTNGINPVQPKQKYVRNVFQGLAIVVGAMVDNRCNFNATNIHFKLNSSIRPTSPTYRPHKIFLPLRHIF